VVYEGTVKPNNVYGITVGTSNGVDIADCHLVGSRHAFTTTHSRADGLNQYGTPLNVVVRDCVVNVPVKITGTTPPTTFETRIGLHTHAEGWGVVFKNNVINVQGAHGNYGIAVASRNVVIQGNVIRGGTNAAGIPLGQGVYTSAANTEVIGNKFEQLLYGVFTGTSSYVTYSDGLVVKDNMFKNIFNAAVLVDVGENVGQGSAAIPQRVKCCIQLGELREFTCTFANGGTTVTCAGHPFAVNMEVFFTAGGGLPAEVTTGVTYYVVTAASGVFTISAARGGAAITFGASTAPNTVHGSKRAGTGIVITRNTSIKGSNTYFIETNDADETNVDVYGNVVIGYAGQAFSDNYSHQAALQTEYETLNFGM